MDDSKANRPATIRDFGPDSLVHHVSDALKDVIMTLPDDLLEMSEKQLKSQCKPTPTDYALRVSFWREYEKLMWKNNPSGKLNMTSIYAGICTDGYFYNKFLKSERKVAWMIRPMQTYMKEMEAILYRGTERLWELIDMSIADKRGNINAKLADVLLKAIDKVENRVNGMAVQRMESKTVSVNVSEPKVKVDSVKELDERIKLLESELSGGGEASSTIIKDEVVVGELVDDDREVVVCKE